MRVIALDRGHFIEAEYEGVQYSSISQTKDYLIILCWMHIASQFLSICSKLKPNSRAIANSYRSPTFSHAAYVIYSLGWHAL